MSPAFTLPAWTSSAPQFRPFRQRPVVDLFVDPDDAPSIVYGAFGGVDPRLYRFRGTAPAVAVTTPAAADSPVELSFGLLRGLGGAPASWCRHRSPPVCRPVSASRPLQSTRC